VPLELHTTWEMWQGMRHLDTVAGGQNSPGQGHRAGGDVAGNGPFPAAPFRPHDCDFTGLTRNPRRLMAQ